jgi:resuscitation-promoting factor RpfA
MWTRARLALLTLADAVAVLGLCPHRSLLAHLIAPHAWIDSAGADAAAAELAAAALWVAAAWLGVGLLCMLAASLPGACGRLAGALARAVLPRAVYRLVAGASGLGLLLTPVAAAADQPRPVTTAAPAWPTSNALPPPAWPVAPAAPATGPAHEQRAPERAEQVVVERGDSLWTIAAEHLTTPHTPQRVAAEWPRWYAANRRVIGADPSLLVPGQILNTPDAEGTR